MEPVNHKYQQAAQEREDKRAKRANGPLSVPIPIERNIKAFKMLLEGDSYETIGKKLGVSKKRFKSRWFGCAHA